MFKIPTAPSRLNPLILSGTISHKADEVGDFFICTFVFFIIK